MTQTSTLKKVIMIKITTLTQIKWYVGFLRPSDTLLMSLQAMLLDIVDNLPRLRLSSNQFRVILWLLKQCKVQQVPSLDSFRKMQVAIRSNCGSDPVHHTSSLGNIFYVNDVRDSVARVCALMSSFLLLFILILLGFFKP